MCITHCSKDPPSIWSVASPSVAEQHYFHPAEDLASEVLLLVFGTTIIGDSETK
jgi:hypothetical protein